MVPPCDELRPQIQAFLEKAGTDISGNKDFSRAAVSVVFPRVRAPSRATSSPAGRRAWTSK